MARGRDATRIVAAVRKQHLAAFPQAHQGERVWGNTTCLSMQRLGLNVMIYDPQVHYQQVRDAWIGVRTSDGR